MVKEVRENGEAPLSGIWSELGTMYVAMGERQFGAEHPSMGPTINRTNRYCEALIRLSPRSVILPYHRPPHTVIPV